MNKKKMITEIFISASSHKDRCGWTTEDFFNMRPERLKILHDKYVKDKNITEQWDAFPDQKDLICREDK